MCLCVCGVCGCGCGWVDAREIGLLIIIYLFSYAQVIVTWFANTARGPVRPDGAPSDDYTAYEKQTGGQVIVVLYHGPDTGDLSAQPTDAKGDVDPAVDDLTGRLIPPHTNMYVSSYYSLCFLILLHLCFRLRRKQRRQCCRTSHGAR